MLSELFFIDGITLNDDRHLNNIQKKVVTYALQKYL